MRRGVIIGLTVAAMLSIAFGGSVPAGGATAAVPTFLTDVSCPSATACYAVGGSFVNPGSKMRSLVERWNGKTWSVMPSPSASTSGNTRVDGISCASATSCIAVGSAVGGPPKYTQTAFAMRLANGTWKTVATPALPGGTYLKLLGVACTGASNCFAVGEYYQGQNPKPLAERWNGTKWTIVPAALPAGRAAGRLFGVGCASPTVCFAVGRTEVGSNQSAAIVERWNGSRWVIDREIKVSGHAPELFSVTCPTAKSCAAVGDNGDADPSTFVTAWNGTAWSIEASPNRSTSDANSLSGVSCWAAGACLAVGWSQEYFSGPTHTLSERRSGSKWSLVASPNKNPKDADLGAIDCIGPKRCFAVGASYAASPVVILSWNGTSWSNVKPG